MTDDTHLATRRTALKGLAAFAGTSTVGAGAILYGSEPAAAVSYVMSVDDITIETTDGEIAEIGLSDLWFETTYENIPHDLMASFSFRASGESSSLGNVMLGLSGEGTETFGYGQAFANEYDTSLDELPQPGILGGEGTFEPPMHTTDESPRQADQSFLEEYSLADGEDEKSVNTELRVSISSKSSADADPNFSSSWDTLGITRPEFDVTIQRISSTGEVSGGEGDAYGED